MAQEACLASAATETALRAFLMYNSEFPVVFWNSLFASLYAREIRAEHPALFPNPGAAIWIERVAARSAA